MKREFQILRGTFSDVYFGAKERGIWKKTNIINYLWLTIIGKMTRVVKKKAPLPEVKEKKEFNIDEFNEWFKTEFDGYDGRKGAAGIFLRLDKFSPDWVKAYLDYIGQDTSTENVLCHYDIAREDWFKKICAK